jgi:glycosyltransferase involved in cell wall biosynthesis
VQQKTTLVIVPAFNEELALPGVLKDLHQAVPELDVLVVDDGSRDDTAAVARAQGVAVARLPFNLGIGAALRTGFRWAAENEYQSAVQFDGDGQHSASEIPKLMQALPSADLVIGSRFVDPSTGYNVGRVRGGGMRFLRGIIRLVTGQRLTDTSSGFRAFSREMIDFFSGTYPAEYMESVEAVLLALYSGFEVKEVAVQMRLRELGRPSVRSLKLVYHYLRLLIILGFTISMRARRKTKELQNDR